MATGYVFVPGSPSGWELASSSNLPSVVDVTDGTTTVTGVTSLDFTSGATVTSGGTGIADVAVASGSITVTDGTTTVDNVTEVDFTSGATVSSGGTGIADVAVTGGGGSSEIGYSEITSSVTITSTSSASPTTIIDSGSLTFDGNPVIAQFFAAQVLCDTNNYGDVVVFTLYDGSTFVAIFWTARSLSTVTKNIVPCAAAFRFTPSSGSHNYIWGAYASSTIGAPGVVAGTGSGGGFMPASVRFSKAT